MAVKKWIDLTQFGMRAVVSSATKQRDKVGLLVIQDRDLLTKKTKLKLDDFLLNAQSKGATVVESEYPNSDIVLMLDPAKNSFSTNHLAQLIPGLDKSYLREMDISEIYINHDANEEEGRVGHWTNLISNGKAQSKTVYIDTKNSALPPSLVEAFQQHDADKVSEMFVDHHMVDAFPLAQLEKYGYKSNESLISYYPSEDMAIAAGVDLMNLKPIQLPSTSVPIKSNSLGQVLAFSDISQIPEMFNYDVSQHSGWKSSYSLPNALLLNHNALAYFDNQFRKLSQYGETLNEDNNSVMLTGLAETNNVINKVLYERHTELKQQFDANSRFDIVKKDNQFKVQSLISTADGVWAIQKEENVNRSNFAACLNDMYVRLSEIHAPINRLRDNLRKDFKQIANSLIVAQSNLEVDLEAQLAYQNSLVSQPSETLEDGIDPNQATAAVEDIEQTASAVLSGQIKVEPGKPLNEAIVVVEPPVYELSPNEISSEVLTEGVEPTRLLADLHKLDQHLNLQAVPNIVEQIKRGEKDRDLLINARQKSSLSNMIVGMGGIPSQIQSLAPYAAHMLHPTTDLVFAQGRLHSVEQQISSDRSYLAYLNDLREHISDYKSNFIKPEYVSNLLLHTPLAECEISAGFKEAKEQVKANFNNETFGFGNIVHENPDFVKFVKNVEARTITRQYISEQPLSPIGFDQVEHSGITAIELIDFENAKPIKNTNTAVADFVIQDRLREYAQMLLADGVNLDADLANSSPNNMLDDSNILSSLNQIGQDANLIERTTGQTIIPMLTSNVAVQNWLKAQTSDDRFDVKPTLGVGDHLQFKALATANILGTILPGVVAHDKTLKTPVLDHAQVQHDLLKTQTALVNFNEGYYRLSASPTHQQAKALHYVQNFIPSLNHEDYSTERKHAWVMNRANSDNPFKISHVDIGLIQHSTQEELNVRNLRDACALGFAAYSRNKLYTDLGFSGDVASNLESLAATHKKHTEVANEQALIDEADRLFKSINPNTANYYKNGIPSLNDFTVDSANLKLSLISDPTVTTQFESGLDLQTTLSAIQTADVLFHKNVSIQPYENSKDTVPSYIANSLNSDKYFSEMFEYMQPTTRERRYEVQANRQSLSDVTHDFVGTTINQFKNNMSMFESSNISYQQDLNVLARTNSNLSYMRVLPNDVINIAKKMAYRDGPSVNRYDKHDLEWEAISTVRLGASTERKELSFDDLKKEIQAKVIELDVARPDQRLNVDDYNQLDENEYEDYLKSTGQTPNVVYRPVDAVIPISLAGKVNLNALPYSTVGMLNRLDNQATSLDTKALPESLKKSLGGISLSQNIYAMPAKMLIDAIELGERKKTSPTTENPNDHLFHRDDFFVYKLPPKANEHGAFVMLPEFVKPPVDGVLQGTFNLRHVDELSTLKSQLEHELKTNGKEVAPLRESVALNAISATGVYYASPSEFLNENAPNASSLMTTVDIKHELSAHTIKFEQSNISNVDDLHKFLMQDVQNQMEALGNPDDYNVVRLTGDSSFVGRYLVVDANKPVNLVNQLSDTFHASMVIDKETFQTNVIESKRRISDSSYYAGPRAVSAVLNNANNLANNQGTTLPVTRAHQVTPYQPVIAARMIKEGIEATKNALIPTMADNSYKPPESVLHPQNALLAYKPATETKHASIAVLPTVHQLNKQKLSDGFVLLSIPTVFNNAPHSLREVVSGLEMSIQNNIDADLKLIATDCNAGAELEEQQQAISVIDATTNQEHLSPPTPPKEPKVTPPKVDQPTSEQNESNTLVTPAPRKSSPSSDDHIEDTGYKIPGAKKDLYNVTLTVSQIEAMTLKQLEGVMKLNKMWKKMPVEEAQEKGIHVRAYMIADCLRKVMPSEPSFPTTVNTSPEQVTRVGVVYNQVVTDVRNAVVDQKDLNGIRKALSDVYESWQANPKFHDEVQRNFRDIHPQIKKFNEEQLAIDRVHALMHEPISNTPVSTEQLKNLENMMAAVTDLTYPMGKAYVKTFTHSSFTDRLPKGIYSRSLLSERQLSPSLDDKQLSMVYAALNPKTETEQTLLKKERQEKNRVIRAEIDELLNAINGETKEMSSKKALMPTIDDPSLMVNDYTDRNGRDVSAEELQHRFGFKACEFGNYLGQKDRQEAINLAYDGCSALAKMIDIPDRMVGFDGLMALANGSRGSTSALAHYESDFRVINLTKKKGFGSFAHEWFHALDNALMDVEVQKNPRLDTFMRSRWLSEQLTKSQPNTVSKTADAMKIMLENMRRPNYEKTDLDGVIRNLREKEEHYKLRVMAMAQQTMTHCSEYGEAAMSEIKKVFKAREENRVEVFKNIDMVENIVAENILNPTKRNVEIDGFRSKAIGYIPGNDATSYSYTLNSYRKTMTEEYEAAGMDEKKLKKKFNNFNQTARSYMASTMIPNLIEDIDALSATRKLCEAMRDHCPEQTIQAENGKGKAVGVIDYLKQRHAALNATVFHRDALYLDGVKGGKNPYWSSVLEEFARCGEAVTIEGQKEKGMGNNDWLVRRDRNDNNSLGFDQHRIMGNTRPLGTEREQIVESYKSFISVAMDHINENLPEIRLRDHKLYIKHELSELQSLDVRNHSREEELRDKLDVIENMSPQDFDAHWRKEYETFMNNDQQRLKLHNKQNQASPSNEQQLDMMG